MKNNAETYAIAYSDAPYLVYGTSAGVFANLTVCPGDIIETPVFTPGSDGAPDLLQFTIKQSGQNGNEFFIPSLCDVTPAAPSVNVQLINEDGSLLVESSMEYGSGTLYMDPGALYNVNYIAAPYGNDVDADQPKTAYVIVNMPALESDHVTDYQFQPSGNSDPDLLTLFINSEDQPDQPTVTHEHMSGPFEISGSINNGVKVQVSVNGRAPIKSPLGKKSYGQDNKMSAV